MSETNNKVFLFFLPELMECGGTGTFHKAFSTRQKAYDYLLERKRVALVLEDISNEKERCNKRNILELTYGDLDYSRFTNRRTDITLYGYIVEAEIK